MAFNFTTKDHDADYRINMPRLPTISAYRVMRLSGRIYEWNRRRKPVKRPVRRKTP